MIDDPEIVALGGGCGSAALAKAMGSGGWRRIGRRSNDIGAYRDGAPWPAHWCGANSGRADVEAP